MEGSWQEGRGLEQPGRCLLGCALLSLVAPSRNPVLPSLPPLKNSPSPVNNQPPFLPPPCSTVKFDRNACVLVNAKGLPIGTRVLGFVTHELRARQMLKIVSLAARVF